MRLRCSRSSSCSGSSARIAAGRWSDVVGSRLRPLRLIALAIVVFVAGSAALLSSPLVVLIPVLVVAGVLSMSWNGLSFAAAVELAGHRRSGAAIGLQQSLLNGSGAIYPGPVRRARRRDVLVVRVRRVRGSHARRLARPPSIAGVSTRAPSGSRRCTRSRSTAPRTRPRRTPRTSSPPAGCATPGSRSRATAPATCSGRAATRACGRARTSTASRPPAASTASSASSPRSRRPTGCATGRSPSSRSAPRSRARWAARRSSRRPTPTSRCTSSKGPCSSGSGEPLGVVTAIGGQARGSKVFEGRADHAGTTPMDVRERRARRGRAVHPPRPRLRGRRRRRDRRRDRGRAEREQRRARRA